MNDIRCPHCKKTFKADEAFAHHIDAERKKFEDEKVKLREDAQVWRERKEKEFAQEVVKQKKLHEEELRKKLEEEVAVKLKDSKNESEELAEKNRKQQEELLEMNKTMRLMKTRQEERELENQKKLAAAEDEIKERIKKQADEENHLKLEQERKRTSDALKQVEDMKRKLEQGSQQSQGEVLELELERALAHEFPFDEIKPVPKGIRGADILHIVRNNSGIQVGTILWELKRTKAWSGDWISKLKDDQREVKADIAILISNVVPETVKLLGEIQEVIVAEYTAAMGVARLVRMRLIELGTYRSAAENSEEKKDVLYNYIMSREFKHRMEAIAEAFKAQRDILQQEKNWFTKKWAKQEKLIDKMQGNSIAMLGEMEAITGHELQEPDELDSLPSDIVVEETIEEELFK